MLNALPQLESWIKTAIVATLPSAHVEVEDYTGGGDHFQVLIVASEFEGLSTLKRHRLIYDAVGDAMRERIHAFTMKTLTPAEWEAAKTAKAR